MIEIQDKFLNPLAILIGSILISLSILVSAGVITLPYVKINKNTQAANVPDVPAGGQTGQRSVAQMIANLKKQAQTLGLKTDQFDQCLDSSKTQSLVQADLQDGSKVNVNGTPAIFINGYMISGAQPNNVFQDTMDFVLAGGTFDNPTDKVKYLIDGSIQNGEIGFPKQTGGYDYTRQTVDVGNLPALGQPNAPLTVVEFSDYQCPFCERFYTQTEVSVIKQYIDSGKVKFYYRDFPLTQIHPGAQKGAEAARCAGEQGKYWEYHNAVFQNQSSIF